MTVAVAWRGEFVELGVDGEWRFHRCIRCDGALSKPNQDGYGPECKRHRPLDWRTERRKKLNADRRRYREDRAALG